MFKVMRCDPVAGDPWRTEVKLFNTYEEAELWVMNLEHSINHPYDEEDVWYEIVVWDVSVGFQKKL
jgi:hypothetical protein